jgi:hypothetical protein
MKIWPRLLSLLLLHSVYAEEGVIVQKVGTAYMFVFPGENAQLHSVAEPKGIVQVGDTITILYWLRIYGDQPRFIAMDAPIKVRPQLFPVTKTGNKWLGGFLIRDSNQKQLDISISPKLWKQVRSVPTRKQLSELEKTMSKMANLSVTIGGDATHFKITKIIID